MHLVNVTTVVQYNAEPNQHCNQLGPSGYPGQMGHFFSRSCGSLAKAQEIRIDPGL